MLKNIKQKARFVASGMMVFMIVPSNNSLAGNFAETFTSVSSDSTKRSVDSLTLGTVIDCPEKTVTLQAPAIKLNAAASTYVKKFIPKNIEDLKMVDKRKGKYFGIIVPVLKKYGIPEELKYLAVVESQLKPTAMSRVGARGMWQLMPATARELGLKVNGKTDERTHAYKSTVAAAKYLRDLHKMFGDWLLVVAAYNSGPGYVLKAIKKSGSRNFWKLQNFLPSETRSHVKRFIGTHCYFQEELSLTILTKQETIAYQDALKKFHISMELSKVEADLAAGELKEEKIKETK